MATMYCALCRRPVDARRQIGAGTIVLAVVTGGMWLVAIPFYRKRCAICRTAAVSDAAPDGTPLFQLTRLPDRLSAVEQRLRLTEVELETASGELDRLREERDFYRDLVREPPGRRTGPRQT